VTVGVAALTAALVLGASLDHMLRTPKLYGLTWDTTLTNFRFGADLSTLGVQAVRATGDADAVAIAGAFGDPADVDGHQAFILAVDPVYGDVLPPIIEGRAPRDDHEVALGARTMRAASLQLGDVTTVRAPGAGMLDMRVVGKAVVPTTNEAARLGEGALVTLGAARLLDPDEGLDVGLLVRRAPGVTEAQLRSAVEAELKRLCAETSDPTCEFGTDVFVLPVETPDTFVNFGGAEATPLMVGGIMAALAAGTLAYVLVSAVQRRRHDFALLKALGFVRAQLAATVACEATVVAVLAVAIGLPLGIAAGRWAWAMLAAELGVIEVWRLPAIALAGVVAGALVLAIVIAALPGRAAAATEPATVLRSE
jgi:hypothetical protein